MVLILYFAGIKEFTDSALRIKHLDDSSLTKNQVENERGKKDEGPIL